MVIFPRRFSQVLNDAITGLGAVWKVLAWPAILVFVPVSLATILAFELTGGAGFLELILNNPDRVQTLPEEVFSELAQSFYIAAGIAAIIQLIGAVFLALASHRAVASQLSGRPVTSREAVRHALGRYPVGLGAALILVVVIGVLAGAGITVWLMPLTSVGTPNSASTMVALLLLVVFLGPAIWVWVAMSMTTPSISIERQGALAAIRRSMQLVRGRWWPTAGFLVLVGLLGGISIQLIQLIALPLALVGGGGATFTIAAGLGTVAQGLLIAAIAAMYTHWYVDLRARKENLSTDNLG